jgi:histidyl-tRNA synthetase
MSNNKIQTLKGFRDFLPEEALKRQWLKNKLVEIFEIWGYDPMETPTLEPLEIFKGQVGEDEKLFFQFEDQGGRKVALRYDQTIPTCRAIGQYSNELVMPFRRYQMQSAFRSEKPQKGRYREFLQCDADIFGITSPLADAEVIALSLDIYKRLGFKKAVVLINDRELLNDLPYDAIVSIDKLKKIGKDGVISEMVAKGIPQDKAVEYFDFVTLLKPNERINFILDYLKNYGFDESWYKFEPTLARSFSYSSGPIWEIEIPDSTGGSVLGGERYDNIVKSISNIDVPGTGFGLGFDRTLEALAEFKLIPNLKTNSKVLVTIFTEELLSESIKTLKVLRENNINTELYPDQNAKLDKQLKYADKKGIPYVIIIGQEEVDKNIVTLKNLLTKEQRQVTINEVCTLLQESKPI